MPSFNPDRRLRACRICLTLTDTSRPEHAYPDWLRKHLNKLFKNPPPGVTLFPGWEQTRATKLQPVCPACNDTMNTLFENTARDMLKAIIDGKALELSATQQVILASWIAKTALVLLLAQFETIPYPVNIDREGRLRKVERARIALHRMLSRPEPPSDMTIRAGYVGWRTPETNARMVPPYWAMQKPFDFNSIISLPNCVFEVLIGAGPPATTFINATQNDERFVRLWPSLGTSTIWPPAQPLGVGDVIRLRGEWEHSPQAFNPNSFWMVVE